ncbi:MAG: MFS transporter [Firmicutes bacterium]|nr:MFS transporter [Bacillota bacterium]
MSRPLWAIFLTVLASLIGFGIVIPLLPFYASSLGASPLEVGFLFAAYSACQLVAAPILGAWSDRWGRRPVLLLSLLGTAVSFALLALARNLPMLFAARVVDGLSGGNISTARAYIADVTPDDRRARSFGLIGAAFGIGFVLGPALGGALARFGYSTPAWAAVGLTGVAMALAWWWLPETVHRVRAGGPTGWRQLPAALRRPQLRGLLGVDFVYWATAAVYQTTFALFVHRRFGLDATHTGYLLALWGLVGAAVQVGLVGPVGGRWGEGRALAAGLTVAGLSLLGASVSTDLPGFLGSTLVAAVGVGISNPALVSLISRAAASHEQGAVQGVAGTLESLGRMVGPVWGNGLLGAAGEGAAFASAAMIMVLAGVAAGALRLPSQMPQGGERGWTGRSSSTRR